MQVTAYKTRKIVPHDNLEEILTSYLPADIPENSVIAVTSKIVSLCEGRVVAMDGANKDDLIVQEAQMYLPRDENPYNVSLTVTQNILAVSAGIDESNGNGYYVLWPEDPQKSANDIREFLCKKYNRQYIGVVLTDSKTTQMRWGVTAITIAYSGFMPLKNYIQTPDVFGRPFVFEQMSIIDNLACSAALVMGEGAEQTPLALVEDLPMITFTGSNPSREELGSIAITIDKDMYGVFLKNAPWRKGKKSD